MIITKEGNTTIITQERATIIELVTNIDKTYDQIKGDNIIVKLFSVKDVKEAKSRAKEIKEYKIKKMHIDGIKEVDVVDGYKIELEKYDNHDDSGSSDYSYDEVKNI